MVDEQNAYSFCKDNIEKIENYDKAINDKNNMWVCHHKLELTINDEFAHSKDELIRMKMYYNRPYYELVFMTKSEHASLHSTHRSDEQLKKQRNNNKGWHFTEEQRLHLSSIRKGKTVSEDTKRKLSESLKAYWAQRRGGINATT